jgi:hypothetical protein
MSTNYTLVEEIVIIFLCDMVEFPTCPKLVFTEP